MENVFESTSSSDTGDAPSGNSFAPEPTTSGCTSSRSSSTRPCSSSDRTSVALPDMPMFLPACALSSLTAPARSPSSSVVFCQSTFSSVVEATNFGVSFMTDTNGSEAGSCCGQNAAHSSYVCRPSSIESLAAIASPTACPISSLK